MAEAGRLHSPAGMIGRGPPAARVASSQLVGRAQQVERLRSLAHGMAEGSPKVALVAGEAGFGKSRLIGAVAELLRPENIEVLVGHCLDLGPGGPPYAAMTEALRAAGEAVPSAVLDGLTGSADVDRAQLFDSVRGAVETLARDHRVVLVVEDLHWADRATRQLLLYLLTTAHEAHWALVATYRSEEVRARRELRDFLAMLGRDPVERVYVPALSTEEVAAQIEDITGRRPSHDTAATMLARSGGSPLLVEELVAAERAGISGVPDHLHDTLLTRVETLAHDAQELVAAASVCGAVCDEDLVQAVLGWEYARVEKALAQAVHTGLLIVTSGRYQFRHELLREAVYLEVLPGQRRDMHARVAAALEAVPATDSATLAHHWYHARHAEAAAQAALAAGATAARAQAPAAVHAQLERVIELWDDLSAELQEKAGGRAPLLDRSAQAAVLSARAIRAVELCEESVALSVDAPADAAARCERLARYRWTIADGDGTAAAYQRGIELLPGDAPAAVRAWVLSGYAWWLAMIFSYDKAATVARAALDAADESADPRMRCRALVSWAGAQADPAEAAAAAITAKDVALSLEDEEQAAQAYAARNLALWRSGAVRERADYLQEGLNHLRAPALRSYLMMYLSDSMITLGRWDEADAMLVDVATRSIDAGAPMITYYAIAPRARIAALRGETGQAREIAADVAAMFTGVRQQPHPALIALLAEAEAALWDADTATAVTAAERAAEISPIELPLAAEAGMTGLRAWADVAEHARRTGDSDELSGAAAAAHELMARFPEPRNESLGRYATTARAELTRLDGPSDPAAWRAAVTAWDRAEDSFRSAYARWRLGEALLADRSGRAEAREVLAEARERASALGARRLLEAIEDREARSRLRAASPDTASSAAAAATALGLTAREHEILTWVTAGRTNREIAEALWLSPRTVSTHLSRVLRKLGVSTRTQVADTAHRLGLLPDD